MNTRSTLVAGQVALSIVLLNGAALLLESLARLDRVNPGFESANLLTLDIALPPTRYDTAQKRATFFREVVGRVDSVPGVRSAAVAWTLPLTGPPESPVEVVEHPPVKFNERPLAVLEMITPGYFRTLEIPLKRGREFTAHDIARSVPVAVVSESFARRFWPAYPKGPSPVGEHILVGNIWAPVEIVGIVADVHQTGLDARAGPELYAPCAQHPPQSAALLVRTKGDPLQFVNVVRGRIRAVDPDQPISAVKTMEQVVEASVGQRRVVLLLLGLFAGMALLLAAVGIYGVVSYSVSQRTHEISIRMALGAEKVDVLRLVVGQGLTPALVGLAAGILGALGLTHLLSCQLYGVKPTDPVTFIVVSLALIAVAFLACYIPARRAANVDPMAALRCE